MYEKWKFWIVVVVLLGVVPGVRAETLTIPVTKDAGYDWRGWFSTDYGYIYCSSSAKAHFYADVLSQITQTGMATTVYSAKFYYCVGNSWENNLPYTIQAFRIDDDWNETTGPLPSCGEGYGSYSGSQLTGWFALDVRELVQAWADGVYSNYGLMLTDTLSYASQGIYSREGTEGYRPYFVIEYALSPIVEVDIPVSKDSGYDWRGWISQDSGCVFASSCATAYFYADILSQITAPGRITKVISASLNYEVMGYWENNTPYTIQAFRVAEDWDESSGPVPDYEEGYGTYSGSQLNGWFSLDLKNLVQAWADGMYTNYGVMLTDTVSYASQGVATRENVEASRPYFTIQYAISDLTRGHQLLIQKGIQVQALAFPWVTSSQEGFSLSGFNDSNFTSLTFWECEYPTDVISDLPGPQWGRWTRSSSYMDLSTNELPYLPQMVNFQYFDEPDIVGNPSLIQTMKDWFALNRWRYPDVITHTDIGGLVSYANHKNFVVTAQPDMVLSSWYPYDPNCATILGGSPTTLYDHLQILRKIGLEGLDGYGEHPIPYGIFNQTCFLNNRAPSESEFRLNDFAALAFGFKYLCAFLYSTTGDYVITSILFDGLGDGSPTDAFYQMADLNEMIQKLGPALVRLISTDVQMKMGEHFVSPSSYVDNALPTDVTEWDDTSAPYITAIDAYNLGSFNDGLTGDVILGFFEPLHESFDGSSYSDQQYFMVVNGLTDALGDADSCSQFIMITFDFDSSGITGLQRMRRSDGVVEDIVVGGHYDGLWFNSLGGNVYQLLIVLPGGTGDLFKYDTGAPFVGSIE